MLGLALFEDFGLEMKDYKPLKILVGSKDRRPTSEEWSQYLSTLEFYAHNSVPKTHHH